ncbi:MAG: tetratricopeptide repeat protein [Armatimonadetes bacterium]|nr:tetratricopeptide repeat protein [Armatimonadota bacterium]
MQIAVLPLNAGPDTRPALARQLSNFACEIARNVTGKEVHAVNYMAQYPDDSGATRFAMVNPNEALNEHEIIQQFFSQAQMERLVDGLLTERQGGGGNVTLRVFKQGVNEPEASEDFTYLPGGIFTPVRGFVTMLVKQIDGVMPAEMEDDVNLFGTSNPEAFEQFLIGFDAVQYIEKAQGMVALEFEPGLAIEALQKALALDSGWEAPFVALLNLTRLCTQYRIGNPETLEKTIKDLTESEPDDPRGWFALGDFYGVVGNAQGAADNMEKAIVKLQMRAAKLHKDAEEARKAGDTAGAESLESEAQRTANDEAPILSRLGMAQMNMGMPANAERNFKRAVELEGPDKPSLGLLSQVLAQTGRSHEIPPLWKSVVDSSPQNPQAWVNYAMSLLQSGKDDEGVQAFESALTTLEEPTFAKRFYAAYLAQKGDLDRAMDLYEDVLEVAPTEVPVLWEYAQTLTAAKRAFEAPKPLREMLNQNPEPNLRANAQAMLLKIEQPKRVEGVDNAAKKLAEGDAEGALKELKPLKNWLGDYWELWMHLADAHNRLGEYKEAEEACAQLLNMFPGCEPAYALLAASLHGQDRDEDAYNFLRNAMMNMQGSLTVGLNLAQACKWSGRDDEARDLIRQMREATGNNPEIGEILDQIEHGDGPRIELA